MTIPETMAICYYYGPRDTNNFFSQVGSSFSPSFSLLTTIAIVTHHHRHRPLLRVKIGYPLDLQRIHFPPSPTTLKADVEVFGSDSKLTKLGIRG
ncbi:hypothetical protein L2E82_15604 [Cichorium intybus]|uniref:Uncharacterized protein n=1 Tax=Cichorium intybus TaxID=13427 RepID=A0ACB9F4F7_CICIN|nr:hypothetical protein L2E82_15604 [Cichorium intybus]